MFSPGCDANAAALASETRVRELTDRAAQIAGAISVLQGELVDTVTALRAEPTLDAPMRAHLGLRCGLTPTEAGQLVEAADRLAELPHCHEKLATGEMSLGAVLSVARRATPELEATILHSTRDATAAQLQTLLRQWARVAAPSERDHPPDPGREPRSRMRMGWRGERLRGTFDLDQTDGLALAAAIEGRRRDLDDQTHENDPGDGVPHHQATNAAALVALADTTIDASATDGIAPDRFHTQIVIHARELPHDEGLQIERAYIHGGPPIPPCLLPSLAAQGSWTATVVVAGMPITMTSPTRFATPAQRRALIARDNCCQYPGCGATTTLIAHHVEPHPQGPTNLANLVLVCRRHHRHIHRRHLHPHWTDGHWQWTWPPRRPTPAPEPTVLAPRRTGTGDRLTHWAADVIITQWLTAA